MGGRRRRTGRKQRGGNFFGVVGGDPGLGTAGARYVAVPNLAVDKGGNPIPDGPMPTQQLGGRRRRTGKKRLTRRGGRKSRRVMPRRRRTMRGGANSYNAGAIGYGYMKPGTLTSGPPDVGSYNPRAGGAPVDAANVSIAS